MVRGFNGPPDPHMLHREPLRPDELDRQVIRGMTGFEFGADEDVETKLVAVLESEGYIRAVQHWERKRSIGGHLNGHGSHGNSRWGDLSNSSLALSFDGTTSGKTEPPTPKKSKRFSGFDFYRRRLFSPVSSPPHSPMSNSPPNSQNSLSHHPTSAEPNREPLDPTSGFHPLISMYYLAREKLERERVYGPGQFASSQLSMQDPNAPNVISPPSYTTLVNDDNVNGATKPSNTTTATTQRKDSAPTGGKADYSMALPRLPAPATSHYSGMSYDNNTAPSPTSPAFHPQQPRARDPGLPPPSTSSNSNNNSPHLESQTMKASRVLPRAPPASTHRRSHSMSQRPTGAVRTWGGMFGGAGPPPPTEMGMGVDEHGVPLREPPRTVGPEVTTFAEKTGVKEEQEGTQPQQDEEDEEEREVGAHGGGPLSAGATLVRKFGSLLVGGGGGTHDSRKNQHGTVGKRGTILPGLAASSPRPSVDAERKNTVEDVGGDQQQQQHQLASVDEKEKAEEEERPHIQIQSPPLSAHETPMAHSVSQPVAAVHRRAATVLDPHGRASRHGRRSSTSAAFASNTSNEAGGTFGRHRRPSTGYGGVAKPLVDRLFARPDQGQDLAEGREEEGDAEERGSGEHPDHHHHQGAEETFREEDERHHNDKDFKPVFLKGLFRLLFP